VRDGPGGETVGDEGGLSVSDRFELLSSARRRATVRYLRSTPETAVDTGTVATHLSGREDALTPESELTALRAVDFPKLDAAGVVDFDREANRITYRGDEGIETLLDVVSE
jgi:hypothetical protein